jgi:hypothetical protein
MKTPPIGTLWCCLSWHPCQRKGISFCDRHKVAKCALSKTLSFYISRPRDNKERTISRSEGARWLVPVDKILFGGMLYDVCLSVWQ